MSECSDSESSMRKLDAEIPKRIDQNFNELVTCINVERLYPLLCSKNLLRGIESKRLLNNEHVGLREKVEHIRSCAEREGPGGYVKLLECLKESDDHMGHGYLAVLLKGEQYGEREELARSAQLKEEIRKHMGDIMDVDFSTLAPVMFENELLTGKEFECLSSFQPFMSQHKKVSFLDMVLETKGPLAHGKFTKCLGEEGTQPIHRELYVKISGKELPELPLRKRRRTTSGFALESDSISHVAVKQRRLSSSLGPSRRYPVLLEMQAPLKGNWYDECICKFQTYQHNGEWTEVEVLSDDLMAMKNPEIQAVALLEKAISFIFRGQGEMVKVCVTEARMLAKNLPVECDNSRFLMARCNHVLSCHHKYAKEYDEAKRLLSEARGHLSNCEHGEDLSWVNYCEASIQLAELQGSSSPSSEGLEKTKELYRFAIACARNHTTGTDVVEQHSHIRLAQLALSTQSTSSWAADDNLQTARNSLNEVKEETLSRRSKSLFFIFRSDLYKREGTTSVALGYAMEAKKIAKEDGYKAELRLAESRITALE